MIKLAKILEPKKFDDLGHLVSMSQEALAAHLALYENYVENYNRIEDLLKDPSTDCLGELRRRWIWAQNGILLHELFFDNLGGDNPNPGPETVELIAEGLPSLDVFKEMVNAVGMIPHVGWVVWGYSVLEGTTHIWPIEEHQNYCPFGFFPLLVIDVWEHAYYLNWLTERADYLSAIWLDVNWQVVEKRVRLLNKFKELAATFK